MHSVLRSVVETVVTLAFVAWAVPFLTLHLWRNLRIRSEQMKRLVTPAERILSVAFVLCITLVEPLAVHLHHFVPDGVAAPLPTAALLSWATASVFSAWCIGLAVWARSYLRGLMYLPIPFQTSALLFVTIDSVSEGRASLVTALVVVAALVGVWTSLFLPKMFQTTEEMLCAIDPATASYAMTRFLSKNPLGQPLPPGDRT